MRTLFETIRVDRTAIDRAPLTQQGHDRDFWLKQSRKKRLVALELLRQLNYNYDPDTARLSRLHRPVKRKAR
jgi:hypothetical protein